MHRNSVALDLRQITGINYTCREHKIVELLRTGTFEEKSDFEATLSEAITTAYQQDFGNDTDLSLIQRVLYQINQMNLGWSDDLQYCTNRQSLYLYYLRSSIESAWQNWEIKQIDLVQLQQLDAKEALIERASAIPLVSPDINYIREQMSHVAYEHWLAINSFENIANLNHIAMKDIKGSRLRILHQEYNNGLLRRKTSLENIDLVPWELLACANYYFLLTENKSHFLRYVGSLICHEITKSITNKNYQMAAQRLGVLKETTNSEDLCHKEWILNEVALPLIEMYPHQAWELVLGYDLYQIMSDRASASIVRAMREEEQALTLYQEIEKIKRSNGIINRK